LWAWPCRFARGEDLPRHGPQYRTYDGMTPLRRAALLSKWGHRLRHQERPPQVTPSTGRAR
jgi:hypothetical protein